jgi:glutathione S-transferase
MITLFGNLESGNVHKVAMLFHRLEIPYRRVDVAQPRGEPRHPAFLAVNPIGKVPAVMRDDGDVLTESGAILYHFAQGTALWPDSLRERTEVLRWMFFEQYSHEPALAVMRYLRLFADGPEKYKDRLEELRPRAYHALSVLDRQLDQWKFVVAAKPTIADYALYPYTAWSVESGVALDDFPNILRWLRQLEDEPRFLPLLKDGAAEVVTFARYFDLPA